MTEPDVISLSSDSSRPSSPFINVSEVFNDTDKRKSLIDTVSHHLDSSLSEKDSINSTINLKYSPVKNRIMHTLSDSDSSENELTGNSILNSEENKQIVDRPPSRDKKNVFFTTNATSLNEECGTLFEIQENSRKRKIDPKTKVKMTKEQRQEEKDRKQKEKEIKKAEKRTAQALQKQIKPGHCMKYMTVVLDQSLVTCPFGGSLLAAIQNSHAKCEVSTQTVPFTISWTRDLPGSGKTEENDVVLIWQWDIFIPAVKSHTLCSQIQDIKLRCQNKSTCLVVYGLNSYFSNLKSRKGKRNDEGQGLPFVTRSQIEEELIELQIMANCNHRMIDSSEDLGELIVHITKAIAETPFKLDKQKRLVENLEWFAVGDSRDCVAVDKAGNGLLRLWQQQLCQFNLAGHDVAQAITMVYPSPVALVQAYDECRTQKEGEELLKDIQVRRCQGPLSSSRRIGPELSKKIYTYLNSSDGEAPLSQEQ